MGMPFEGIGYAGCDNVQKRYVGTSMDTFGTSIMNSISVGRPTDKEIRSEAGCFEPSGKWNRSDTIVRIKDRNRHSYEMWTKVKPAIATLWIALSLPAVGAQEGPGK